LGIGVEGRGRRTGSGQNGRHKGGWDELAWTSRTEMREMREMRGKMAGIKGWKEGRQGGRKGAKNGFSALVGKNFKFF